MDTLLENNALRLRAPEPEDMDLLYAWENDTSMWENGASIVPFSRYSIKQYLSDCKYDIFADKQLRLMVECRETGLCAGAVDLYDFDPFHRRAGVGILIDPAHRRHGYALQALSLLAEYAFRFLNLRQLYAIVSAHNGASAKLFAKAGYRQTGVLEQWLSDGNSFRDALVMQKINPY